MVFERCVYVYLSTIKLANIVNDTETGNGFFAVFTPPTKPNDEK